MRLLSALAVTALAVAGWQSCRAADSTAPSGPAPAALPAVRGEPAACCASPCDAGCAACDCAEECGHFFAGAGFYLLKPKVPNNVAFRSHLEFLDANRTFQGASTETEFHHDLEFGPRVWIGYTTACGLGIRGRWWQLEQGSGVTAVNNGPPDGTGVTAQALTFVTASPFFGRPGLHVAEEGAVINNIDAGPGNTLLLHNDVRLNVWDLEATQELRICKTSLLISGGVRYAHLDQDYTATEVQFAPVVPFPVRRIIYSANTFDGVGPTMALEVRRPLGCTGLALYGNARGSVLFGDRRARAFFTQTNFESGATEINQSFGFRNNEVIPVGEIEVGAEWSTCMSGFRPFVQAAFVGQSWFGAGSATSDNGNLGLIGLTVNAGISY